MSADFETKYRAFQNTVEPHQYICIDSEELQHGMGFAVRLNHRLVEVKNMSDGICALTIEKIVVTTQDILQTPRKYSPQKTKKLTIINRYAPHVGITKYDESLTEIFYKSLCDTIAKIKEQECGVAGEFHAKVGKRKSQKA